MPYSDIKEKYNQTLALIKKQFALVGYLRLLTSILFIVCIFKYYKTTQLLFLLGLISLPVLFIYLLKKHQQLKFKRSFFQSLVDISANEISYLKRESIPFENGNSYVDGTNFFTFDLDVFGSHSLFHNLNRTATYIGEKTLANRLINLLPFEEIKPNQKAILELAKQINFRQELNALVKMTNDNKKDYSELIEWSKEPVEVTGIAVKVISFLLPILFFVTLFSAIFSGKIIFVYLNNMVFLLQLMVLVFQLKKIKTQLFKADKIDKIIANYALILKKIESTSFESEKLQELKQMLTKEDDVASVQLKKLSQLLSNLGNIQNGAGALIFNGTILYHLHVLFALEKWKINHAIEIEKWLNVIGEFEALSSLANFSFNNPNFVFPQLNNELIVDFKNLGHPLIDEQKRVCNEVSFSPANFMILTGSNMSGKSTFLRTLGTNMLLAQTGSVVCATEANLHPLPIIVSMRISDSLNDSESYFFAEVKRLKMMMDLLCEKTCFVLLDEILRGTNSDDKRAGTIGVIKKMVAHKAIGAIATHDLEVCLITDSYPETLMNKCFEVEIINNELTFDYKLRNGICKNKSATFLMKKMEII